MAVPSVTAAQMREVDRLLVEEVGIGLLQMMENAGRALATQARVMLGGSALGRRVLVAAGPGGNGGGGLAAARRLAVWGAEVEVFLAQPAVDLAAAPAHQLASLRWMSVPSCDAGPPPGSDLVIDAVFGYSLTGPPRGRAAELITAINAASSPVLALDLPSGLHPDSGMPLEPAIRASATLTLGLPKAGLLKTRARTWVGDLFLADISIPDAVYRQLGLAVEPLFASSDVIQIPMPDDAEPSASSSAT